LACNVATNQTRTNENHYDILSQNIEKAKKIYFHTRMLAFYRDCVTKIWYPGRDSTRQSRVPEQSDGNPQKVSNPIFVKQKFKVKRKSICEENLFS